jgi:hypothetical protein
MDDRESTDDAETHAPELEREELATHMKKPEKEKGGEYREHVPIAHFLVSLQSDDFGLKARIDNGPMVAPFTGWPDLLKSVQMLSYTLDPILLYRCLQKG